MTRLVRITLESKCPETEPEILRTIGGGDTPHWVAWDLDDNEWVTYAVASKPMSAVDVAKTMFHPDEVEKVWDTGDMVLALIDDDSDWRWVVNCVNWDFHPEVFDHEPNAADILSAFLGAGISGPYQHNGGKFMEQIDDGGKWNLIADGSNVKTYHVFNTYVEEADDEIWRLKVEITKTRQQK